VQAAVSTAPVMHTAVRAAANGATADVTVPKAEVMEETLRDALETRKAVPMEAVHMTT